MKKKQVHFEVMPDVYAFVVRLADAEDRSVAAVMRRAIDLLREEAEEKAEGDALPHSSQRHP